MTLRTLGTNVAALNNATARHLSWTIASDYGAKGDGVTNDTAALTAAIAAAHAGSGRLFLSEGTYLVDTLQLPVPAQRVGLTMRGAGMGRTTIKGNSAVPQIIAGDGGALDAQSLEVSDLSLDGNNVATEGLRMNGTRFLKVYRVDLLNHATYNLNVIGGVANYFADFQGCRFSAAPIPVYLDGGSGVGANSNYFTRCHFGSGTNVNYNSAGTAISIVINGGDSNIFRDNEFSATGTPIYLHNTAVYNKITGNQFDNNPTVSVNCASAGVQQTVISKNTGTVIVVDNGASTEIDQPNASSITGTSTTTKITSGAITDTFTTSGTWTKRFGAKTVRATVIAAGGGGGSGRQGVAASIRCGGGGGAGGSVSDFLLPASILGSTETVAVGTGGAGGAAQATSGSNGNNGVAGGNSSFGVHVIASGGAAGSGGTSASGSAGGAGSGRFPGGSGGGASATGGAGSGGGSGPGSTAGGGGGGGITSADSPSAGGTGSYGPGRTGATTGGAINTAGGSGTSVATGAPEPGGGGAGGGASITGAGGAGGNGGLYGAGGGGGGASLNGASSGAGGNGADGVVVVTTYF